MKILIIEDDQSVAELERDYLEINGGFQCDLYTDGTQGLQAALAGDYALVIVDVMLPGLSGFEICRRLREVKDTPVIIISALADDIDKVRGLGLGADDYMTKPFAIEELLARIRAALRKRPAQAAEPPRSLLTAGPLTMDTDRHEVSVNGEGVELTRREFDLLRYLLENKERVISRESLLDHVWGFDFVGETNAVDVYIRFLRAKIDEHFGIKLIHTVRGVGYVIREEGQ